MKAEGARVVVGDLREAGIDFITRLLETRMSETLPLMRGGTAFTPAPVASEAEAVGIAARRITGGGLHGRHGRFRLGLQSIDHRLPLRRLDAGSGDVRGRSGRPTE